jgi:hypothetical protein
MVALAGQRRQLQHLQQKQNDELLVVTAALELAYMFFADTLMPLEQTRKSVIRIVVTY